MVRTAQCFVCGVTAELEWHEPAGRQNVADVRVRLCKACHYRETFLYQLDHGFDLSPGRRTHLDEAWPLFQGVPHLLAEQVRAEQGDSSLASVFDRSAVIFAATIEEMSRALDEPLRHQGPDPIANDRRQRRRRKTKPSWQEGRVSEGAGADGSDRLRFLQVIELFDNMAQALFEPMGTATELPGRWAEIGSDPNALYSRLEDWEDDVGLLTRANDALELFMGFLLDIVERLSSQTATMEQWRSEMVCLDPIIRALEDFLLATARADEHRAEAAIDTLISECTRTARTAISR